jgi:hypothetical protein
MEQRYCFTAYRIDSGKVRPFLQIAAMARQRQIVPAITPTMLLRNDVLNALKDVAVRLADQTILATIPCAPPNGIANPSIYCQSDLLTGAGNQMPLNLKLQD